MSRDEIAIALEPFGQVENSLSKSHAGTGLGLPLANRLAELHGGRLEIESAKGRGTTVLLHLPADRVPLRRPRTRKRRRIDREECCRKDLVLSSKEFRCKITLLSDGPSKLQERFCDIGTSLAVISLEASMTIESVLSVEGIGKACIADTVIKVPVRLEAAEAGGRHRHAPFGSGDWATR